MVIQLLRKSSNTPESYAKIQLCRHGLEGQGNQGHSRGRKPERGHWPHQRDGVLPNQSRRRLLGGPARGAAKKAPGQGQEGRRDERQPNIQIPGLSGRVKSKVLTNFTRQLATLVQAGLPLLRGLRVLQKQERNANLKNILGELAVSIEGGSTFSESLAQHPKVFNKLFVNMVKAGEIGGVLEVVLKRLSEFMEKAQKIRGKVIAAMFYPCAVMVVATAIMGVLMVMVIPKFKEIFAGALGNGRELPGFTVFVLDISAATGDHFIRTVIEVVVIVILFNIFIRTKFGRRLWDKFKLVVPVLGPVVSKVAISRFTRTLGTLISSGVPILRALTIVKETLRQRHRRARGEHDSRERQGR